MKMDVLRPARLLTVLALIGIMAFAGTTVAHAYGYGKGHGHGCAHGGMELTPEQRQKVDAIFDTFAKRNQPVHEELRAKHMELNALSGNTKVEPEVISKLVADIKELRGKLLAEREAFHAEVEKEVGVSLPKHGKGYHGGGYGTGCGGGCPGMAKRGGGCPYSN